MALLAQQAELAPLRQPINGTLAVREASEKEMADRASRIATATTLLSWLVRLDTGFSLDAPVSMLLKACRALRPRGMLRLGA